MNISIWELLLNVIGWLILALIVYSVAVVITRGIRKQLAARVARKTNLAKGQLSDAAVIELATEAAKDLYKNDIQVNRNVHIFVAGVKFGLGTRKAK